MTKLFIIAALSMLTFLGMAQPEGELLALLNNTEPVKRSLSTPAPQALEENLLNTVKITLDKEHNRINFTTPHTIEGINITIKQRGERIIIQQNNMTISKDYSITFPAPAGVNRYTVILQKDNHILVERLEKDWM